MKGKILIIVSLCISLLLGACNNSTEQSQPKEVKEAQAPENNSKQEPTKDAIVLTVGHVVPENHPSHITLGVGFEEYVERESQGRIDVQVFPNGQLGGERQQVEAVSLGTLDMSIPATSAVANFDEDYFVFDLPFLFDDLDAARSACDGDFGKKVDANLDKVNIINLGYAENGFRYVTNNVRPIKNPEDLKGLKVRTMENPIHMATFEAFGANPTPMAFGELYTALQQKTVDAQENPVGLIYTNKFYEVQKYMSMTGHVYMPCPYIINKTKYESLPTDLQKIVSDGVKDSIGKQRNMLEEQSDIMLKEIEESGTQINYLSDGERKLFLEAVQLVYDDFIEKYGVELVDEAKSYNK